MPRNLVLLYSSVANLVLQMIHAAGVSQLQSSRLGLTTSVGKAISAGCCWMVSIPQPKSIGFIPLFLKRKHFCFCHLTFFPVSN